MFNHPNIEVLPVEDGEGLHTIERVTDVERAAVIQIANALTTASVEVLGRDDDNLLVVQRYDTPAAAHMPYDVMYVDERGRFAEAMLNQPVYHRTFHEMVEDVRHNAGERADEGRSQS